MNEKSKINWANEEAYWKQKHAGQPYAKSEYTYEHYAPAYRTATESYEKYKDRDFVDAEGDLARDYERGRGDSGLPWDHARHAVQAVWAKLGNDVTPMSVDRGIQTGI